MILRDICIEVLLTGRGNRCENTPQQHTKKKAALGTVRIAATHSTIYNSTQYLGDVLAGCTEQGCCLNERPESVVTREGVPSDFKQHLCE